MKALIVTLLLGTALAAAPAGKTQFSGGWTFDPAHSENVGMMSGMEWTVTIQQTDTQLNERDDTVFTGQHQTRDVTYDLSGREVANPGPMGESCMTQTKWDGSRLVTTWTSDGAVAGTKVIRTETRFLSADGRTMSVESRRGAAAPIVMVFQKK